MRDLITAGEAADYFESSHNARILEAEDMLEAPTLLPGFSVRVSEFFA